MTRSVIHDSHFRCFLISLPRKYDEFLGEKKCERFLVEGYLKMSCVIEVLININ